MSTFYPKYTQTSDHQYICLFLPRLKFKFINLFYSIYPLSIIHPPKLKPFYFPHYSIIIIRKRRIFFSTAFFRIKYRFNILFTIYHFGALSCIICFGYVTNNTIFNIFKLMICLLLADSRSTTSKR